MMGLFGSKKDHRGGLFSSDYVSDDYKEKQRQKEEDEKRRREKEEEKERERKRKEKEKYDREIRESMEMGNKGKKKSSWW